MKQKKNKGEFLSLLSGTLGTSLLANLLTGKKVIATSQGRDTIRAAESTITTDEGTITAGQDF